MENTIYYSYTDTDGMEIFKKIYPAVFESKNENNITITEFSLAKKKRNYKEYNSENDWKTAQF